LTTPAGTVKVPEPVKTCPAAPGDVGDVLDQVVPLLVRTFPLLLGATTCNAPVPLPSSTLLAASVVDPVPPLATGAALTRPVLASSLPEVFTKLASCERLKAIVMLHLCEQKSVEQGY
jgi:hypothetical protein